MITKEQIKKEIELMSNNDIKDAIGATIAMIKGAPPTNEVMEMLETLEY